MNKRAYAYLRVSGPGQADDAKDGYPRQRAAIKRYAKAQGIKIEDEFRDAITGTTLVGTIQASLIALAPAGLGAQPSLWAVRPCRRCIGVATAAFRGLRECAARRICFCCRYYCPADAITVAITLVRPGNSCNSVAITVIAREATHSNSCNSESRYYWRYYSD